MKVNRTYCISQENADLLKGFNASELINGLLDEHFGAENSEDIDKIRTKTRELMQERAIISRKIKHFRTKTAKIQEKIDKKKQENMDEKQKAKRKIEIEAIKQKYFAGEVSEQEYMDFFK